MYSETNDRNLNFKKATLYKENWYALLISIILNKSISKSLSIMKAREDQYIKLKELTLQEARIANRMKEFVK
ncbi:MAG: hypothetical protein ACLR3R_18770 [Clostridium paraputrificum]